MAPVTRSLSVLAVLLIMISSTGCVAKMRHLQDENMMLKERALQYQQDLQAMEVRYTQTRTELEELTAQATEQEKQIDVLKDRANVMQRTMSESQKSQAEALLDDLEQRVERENSLKLEVDKLSARVESLSNENELTKNELEKAQARAERLQKELEGTTAKLVEATDALEELLAERDSARAERDDFRRQLQSLESTKTEVTGELETVSGQLRDREKELAAASRELEELRTAKVEKEEAAKVTVAQTESISDALRDVFASELRAGTVAINEEDGLSVILPSDFVFEPGTVLVSSEGGQMVGKFARALKDKEFTRVQVKGHTDSTPVRNMPFVDNWELAAARAASVARFLARQPEISSSKLSASSHAFFDPVATNDTTEGRKQNRRVELVVIP